MWAVHGVFINITVIYMMCTIQKEVSVKTNISSNVFLEASVKLF